MKKHVHCWEHFQCPKTDCPAYGAREDHCWLTSGTLCRDELQGTFLEKMEICLGCEVFQSNHDLDSMRETFHLIHRQFADYRRIVEEKNRQLERLATIDVLTGAFNRVKFEQVLAAEFERARRYATPLSVIVFDVDGLKAINDTCGHHAGDRALRRVAQTALRQIRESDYLFRMGGDEFILLLPQTPLEETTPLAERLRALFTSPEADPCDRLTASFGVATLWPDDTDLTLLKRADLTLYWAKERGRNRVEEEAGPQPAPPTE
jgi:diguanylate cyclase (GGDEF)-like protein